MTVKDYQMFWDCPYCGTKELLGVSHRHCPNCGGAQDENKRYFPPEGKEVELHDHIYYGVDWDCQHCSTPNSKNSNNCVNCGSPQNGAVDVDLVDRPKVKKEEKPKIVKPLIDTVNNTSVNSNPPSEINREKKIPVNENSSIDVKEEEASFLTKFIIIVILGFLVLGVGSFLVNIFSTVTEHNVSVVQKTWQRSVDIEEYRAISDTDWCSSMPSGAYSVSSFREIRSHRQVADGQTCSTVRSDRGDGSYRKERICETKYRSEPVYDKRCNYKINKWKFRNSELSSGGGTSIPKDPNLSHLNLNNSNTLGNIRLGGRSSQYVVSFEYKDEKKDVRKKCSYSQGVWNDFKLNETYKGNVRPFFGLMCNDIGSLMSKK